MNSWNGHCQRWKSAGRDRTVRFKSVFSTFVYSLFECEEIWWSNRVSVDFQRRKNWIHHLDPPRSRQSWSFRHRRRTTINILHVVTTWFIDSSQFLFERKNILVNAPNILTTIRSNERKPMHTHDQPLPSSSCFVRLPKHRSWSKIVNSPPFVCELVVWSPFLSINLRRQSDRNRMGTENMHNYSVEAQIDKNKGSIDEKAEKEMRNCHRSICFD